MSSKGGVIVAAGLLVALIGSAGLNVLLYRFALSEYRHRHSARLDPTDEARFGKLNAELAQEPPGDPRIVFFGDSRVLQWRALPTLGEAELVNRGRGGDTTALLDLRLERDVLALDADIVVLQAGVNDLTTLGTLPWLADRTIALCETHLANIIERLRAQGIEVVLTTILPVGEVPLQRRPVWSERTRQAIAQVNDFLRAAAAKDPGVHLVDLDPVLGDGNLAIRPAYARDTLHLNTAGYHALNASLEPVLAELVANHGKPD